MMALRLVMSSSLVWALRRVVVAWSLLVMALSLVVTALGLLVTTLGLVTHWPKQIQYLTKFPLMEECQKLKQFLNKTTWPQRAVPVPRA
jgi:hypothetical protein